MPDFAPLLAVDPTLGTLVPVADSVFRFYPPGTSSTDGVQPLDVTDLDDNPISTVRSNRYGVLPALRQATYPSMVAVSGNFRTTIMSYDGLAASAAAAAAAAEAAQAAAEAALAAITGNTELPSGGTAGQALVIGPDNTSRIWGTPAIVAAGVTFTPFGSLTSTNVQGAIEQLFDLIAAGGSALLVVQANSDGTWTFPVSLPSSVSLVWARGPVAPSDNDLPDWAANVDGIWSYRE